MQFLENKNIIFLSVLLVAFAAYSSFFYIKDSLAGMVSTKEYIYHGILPQTASISLALQNSPQPLKNPPSIIKAVYVTGWSAGSKKYLAYLDSLIATTQINAVVIDVKDYSGMVSYDTGAPEAEQYHAYQAEIPDIDALITHLHAENVYVIGRVVVFEDPMLAKNRPDLAIYDTSKTTDKSHPVVWENSDGLAWMDPASPDVWNYNIEIAKDALSHGFDEINFDYVRFPTDGNAGNMGFPVWDGKTPRATVIKHFFETLRTSLPGATISADIFGQITTNTDDMGIGQVFENALPYFNYICPMVYPSHYVNGFMGYQNPADYPYQIISYAITTAVTRQKVFSDINSAPSNTLELAKIRPWLQDFNLGATYNASMVEQEIQATSDATKANYNGYLLWNASNIYTQGAIAKNSTDSN